MKHTLILLLSLCSLLRAADKPNIIFIQVDDLLYTYTSVWGSKTSPTVRDAGGKVPFYWEPTCLPLSGVKSLSWSAQALFNAQGDALESLEAF